MPVPDGDTPLALTAYCGELIRQGEAELLDRPPGMPCVDCLFRVPEAQAEAMQAVAMRRKPTRS